MSEPRIIVTTLADTEALAVGSSEHSISADDLALLPTMSLDEDEDGRINLAEGHGWSIVDLDSPETPVLPGG